MDESGNFLNYYLLNPQLGTASNAVNTYKVAIPAGESMQSIQVLSALNNIATCVNNCSNVSRVHVSSNSIGVLLVEPNNFVMSESYHSQVVVLKNTGTAMITDLQLPTLESGFTISNSTCGNSLSSGTSCQFVVDYSVGIYSGVNHYEVTYNNGLHDSINMIDISYTGTPAGILTLQPQILTLTSESSVQSIKLINTGNAALTLTSLPILNAPLLQVNTSCQQNQSLLANESCNYTVGYLTAESNGKQLLDFVYNDGKVQNTATSTVNWDTKLTSSRYIFLTSKAYNANLGGFTGANAICQKTAGDMRLAGTFVALLQATSLGINPNPNQPIVNLLGQAIFDSGAFTSNAQYHLWSLSSNNSANICVQGDLMCQNTKFFWSGVTPQSSAITPYDGWTNYPNTAEQNSCNNWTSASPLYNGVYGNTWKTDAPVNIGNPDENQSLWVWLNQTCDNTLSLLCIQQ